MPVRIFYSELKDTPVPLVVDMYQKTIIESLQGDSKMDYLDMISPLEYDFKATDSKEKCIFDNWRDIKNELYFTKGYHEIFKDKQISGLWVAYEALNQIFIKYPGPDFHAPYLHVFHYNKKKFWIVQEVNHIIFATPNEY